MDNKVIVIGVLLVIITALLAVSPVLGDKPRSRPRSKSSQSRQDFPCLESELESCRLKPKTLNRLSIEDLQNAANREECGDVCESVVERKKGRSRGKRLEQCNCLCNYYSVCIGTAVGGSGDEGTGTRRKTKSRKGKKSKSRSEGSGEELIMEEETSKPKKSPKPKGRSRGPRRH